MLEVTLKYHKIVHDEKYIIGYEIKSVKNSVKHYQYFG